MTIKLKEIAMQWKSGRETGIIFSRIPERPAITIRLSIKKLRRDF
jgi:hypothetical protein